jgi:multidrug efflux pump subunit AcrA (membrane-fusion protein)
MSIKHRRQKQKKNFPWLLLAIGGVLLVAAVFIFANQGGSDGGTPSIAVDQQKIDYGDVKFGVNKTFSIKVTNTGTGTLRFTEQPYIEIVEGC